MRRRRAALILTGNVLLLSAAPGDEDGHAHQEQVQPQHSDHHLLPRLVGVTSERIVFVIAR